MCCTFPFYFSNYISIKSVFLGVVVGFVVEDDCHYNTMCNK